MSTVAQNGKITAELYEIFSPFDCIKYKKFN